MRTMNVQKITREELFEHWQDAELVQVAFYPNHTELFIRSNAKGVVNWDSAPLYTWAEIQKEQQRRPVHFTVYYREFIL